MDEEAWILDIIRRSSTVDGTLFKAALKEQKRIESCRKYKKNLMRQIVRGRGIKAKILRAKLIFNKFGEKPGVDRPYSEFMTNLHQQYNANIDLANQIDDSMI